MTRYVSRTYGVKEILTPDEWRELLINAGLKDIVVRIHKEIMLKNATYLLYSVKLPTLILLK